MDRKIEELKKIKYFDEIEYKFDDYKDVLIKLAEYTPENIKNMYKPFVKKGKYRGQTVNKIVALTRGVLDNEGDFEEIVFLKEYFVSKFGRIKDKNDKILPLYEQNTSDGYLVFSYEDEENKKIEECLVYNAVAKTFNRVEELEKINYQGYEIHHINNNGYENTPENLIWLTKEQHDIVHGFKK